MTSRKIDSKKEFTKKCIFCKIITGHLEEFVYEDKKVVVLLSKFQTSKGHSIVTFKKHYESIDQISEKDYISLQKIVKKYNKKLTDAFSPEKIYILLLAEEVGHVHFHLIPRYKGDTKGPKFLTENIKEVKNPKKIIQKINQ